MDLRVNLLRSSHFRGRADLDPLRGCESRVWGVPFVRKPTAQAYCASLLRKPNSQSLYHSTKIRPSVPNSILSNAICR